MSGIAGICTFDGSPTDHTLLSGMTKVIAHPGSSCRRWSAPGIGLVEVRTNGEGQAQIRMPAALCCVADAFLTNKEALSITLAQAGFDVSTRTESTLIVLAYSLWGTACLERLQGDFAFALWDATHRQLFAARSPRGLRPLVYHVCGNRLLFASLASSLLEDENVSKDLDPVWISCWLVQGIHHWRGSPYKEIQVLQPGEYLQADEDGISISRYWHPWPRSPLQYKREADYGEHFRSLLFASVRSCLQDAHPLFFELSGGLDSSSLCCLAAQLCQEHQMAPPSCLHVYSTRYKENDDRNYAQAVSEIYQMQTHFLCYEDTPAFAGAFGERLWHDTPTIPTLFLADLYQRYGQLAQAHGVRGLVRGDFGDQLFSSPRDYLLTYWDEQEYSALLRELWLWQRVSGRSLVSIFLESVGKALLLRRKQAHQKNIPDPAPWLQKGVKDLADEQACRDAEDLRAHCPPPLVRLLYRFLLLHGEYSSMQPDLLALGLQTYEPYGDLRLIEFLLSCPAPFQIRFGTTKFLLREAMRGILPEMIRQRRGKGRMARILFDGVATHRQLLSQLIRHAPPILDSYIERATLTSVCNRVALGESVDQPAFFAALALIFWVHRLPWVSGGLLPVREGPVPPRGSVIDGNPEQEGGE